MTGRRGAVLSLPKLGGGDLPLAAFAAIWLFGVAVPLLGIVAFSFLSTKGVRFVYEPTFKAYLEIWETGRFEVTARSLRVMGTITLIELVIAFPFALWLAKGARSNLVKLVTFTLLSVPFFLTPAARTIVWRVVLGRTGLVNSILLDLGVIDQPIDDLLFSEPAVHFAFIGPYFPAMVWPIFLAILLIDDDLLEASKDLGASPARTLRHVVIPLAIPGVVAGIVFTFIPMLGDSVIPKLVGGGQVWLMGESMYNVITALNFSVGAAMSAITLALMALLQVLLWVVFRRVGGMSELFQVLRR